MASKEKGNRDLRSAGSTSFEQQIHDASQDDRFQYPSYDPEGVTALWMRQLNHIWALCRLCMQLIRSLLNVSFVKMSVGV
jgi:hypothetical protein